MKSLSKYFFIVFIFFFNSVFCQERSTFEVNGGYFWLNGKQFTVHSGELHYSRVPSEYWKHRLQITEDVVKQTEMYIKNGVSFNYYMIHGGTNFGFTNGANYDKNHDIQPDLTSYDYDAPISEADWATPKYQALRNIFQKINQEKLPEIPKPMKVITFSHVKLSKSVSLFDLIKNQKPIVKEKPLTFEDLNQGYGYVLYRRKFENSLKGKLEIKGLRDYANL